MRRVTALFVVVFALLAFAPAVSADTFPVPESHESIGFDAFSSECGERTCTDTYINAEEVTTASGETFTYVCVDQHTYSTTRGGRGGTSMFGCSPEGEPVNLTVSGDLSSATLAPTQVLICERRQCETVTVSADLESTSSRFSFRARGTDVIEGCKYTFVDTGTSRGATGTFTIDGQTYSVDGGSIREFESDVSSRC